MKRRDFLGALCLAGLAALAGGCGQEGGPQAIFAGPAAGRQLLELRLYRVSSEAQRKRLDEFLGKVMLPALNRAGVGPVGVFQAADGKTQDLYVLLPHKTAESVIALTARLVADEAFNRDGQAYLDLPKNDPLYDRIESSLLLAFDQAPKVEAPEKTEGRLFQLRIYESHSLRKGQKKIEMFNAGGEIALFRKVGMQSVFFGEALIGAKLPNLTYMLAFPGAEVQKAAWGRFTSSPEWDKLKNDPAYKDTVSNITNLVLLPTPYSQI